VIEEFTDILKTILERIIGLLGFLKEKEVKMPASLKEFIQKYSKQVNHIALLAEHLKIISDNKLI
jgi:hypothetical protein